MEPPRQVASTYMEVHPPDLTVASDVAMARAWYLRAKELGSDEASKRLERLSGADH
jgi:hypothetical protein